MVDYWPSEEGAIVEGGLVLNCYADGAISEGSVVKWGSAGASKLPVAATAAYADGCGVALKAAGAAGDIIPVCFHGLVKMMCGETLTIGAAIVAGGTTGRVFGITAADSDAIEDVTGGTLYVMGYAFGAGNPGDEIPCLIRL